MKMHRERQRRETNFQKRHRKPNRRTERQRLTKRLKARKTEESVEKLEMRG